MGLPCVRQISTLTGLRDLRLKVREIDAEGVLALQTLTDLRSLDLEVRRPEPVLALILVRHCTRGLLCADAHRPYLALTWPGEDPARWHLCFPHVHATQCCFCHMASSFNLCLLHDLFAGPGCA